MNLDKLDKNVQYLLFLSLTVRDIQTKETGFFILTLGENAPFRQKKPVYDRLCVQDCLIRKLRRTGELDKNTQINNNCRLSV